jgi:hypothetical protein
VVRERIDKIYIKGFMTQTGPEKGMEYWFCSVAANAFCWTTKDEAENVGTIIKCHPIQILSSQGTHSCSIFEIEQRAPSEFVIFYEVPTAPASPQHT